MRGFAGELRAVEEHAVVGDRASRFIIRRSTRLAISGSQSLLLESHCGRLDSQSHHCVGVGTTLVYPSAEQCTPRRCSSVGRISPRLNVIIIPRIFIIVTLVSATIPNVRLCPMSLQSGQNTPKCKTDAIPTEFRCTIDRTESPRRKHPMPTGTFSLNAPSFPCWRVL